MAAVQWMERMKIKKKLSIWICKGRGVFSLWRALSGRWHQHRYCSSPIRCKKMTAGKEGLERNSRMSEYFFPFQYISVLKYPSNYSSLGLSEYFFCVKTIAVARNWAEYFRRPQRHFLGTPHSLTLHNIEVVTAGGGDRRDCASIRLVLIFSKINWGDVKGNALHRDSTLGIEATTTRDFHVLNGDHIFRIL